MNVPVAQTAQRIRAAVYGAVQGVGFRPFVFRLAAELELSGWVLNSPAGVFIEVEGPPEALASFLARLGREAPPASQIVAIETSRLDPAGHRSFEIRASGVGSMKTAVVLPDLATCPGCRAEILDPLDRRHRYAFTNCTQCGPRYTIVGAIPYDRPNTTMAGFVMCPECRREYEDPADRRFHAQPNACPECGPSLELVDSRGARLAGDPVREAARLLLSGRIVGLKGIGGFQLLCHAGLGQAVGRLRWLKEREEKPFAVMFPSADSLLAHCEAGAAELELLASGPAPIVLLRPSGGNSLAPEVSKSSPYVGAMLPYSPVHHLLLSECAAPLVATSGNRSDEPIAVDNEEGLRRLGGIADAFLWHDRPIARPCDDSVARVSGGVPTVLRRARGYAPLPVFVGRELPRVLAVGGHLKNAVAIGHGSQVCVSQHVGDLDTEEAREAFRRAIADLCRLYEFEPELVACDLHPDYFSTRHAEGMGLPVVRVQHHHAHVAACAAENDVRGPWLGVAWDGTGYGPDGTVWGGEFFTWDGARFRRIAHFRPFPLPGGESAIREGWRVAHGLLREILGGAYPRLAGRGGKREELLGAMLDAGLNCPLSTSAGRLFDAAAAITGVALENRFEGQAAMLFESALDGARGKGSYRPCLEKGERIVLDWRDMIASMHEEARTGAPVSEIALRFHNTMTEWIVAVARAAGHGHVVLSGGVFQNGYLTERTRQRLCEEGFRTHTHQRVPPNDGGICLGQAILASLPGAGSGFDEMGGAAGDPERASPRPGPSR